MPRPPTITRCAVAVRNSRGQAIIMVLALGILLAMGSFYFMGRYRATMKNVRRTLAMEEWEKVAENLAVVFTNGGNCTNAFQTNGSATVVTLGSSAPVAVTAILGGGIVPVLKVGEAVGDFIATSATLTLREGPTFIAGSAPARNRFLATLTVQGQPSPVTSAYNTKTLNFTMTIVTLAGGVAQPIVTCRRGSLSPISDICNSIVGGFRDPDVGKCVIRARPATSDPVGSVNGQRWIRADLAMPGVNQMFILN